MRGARRIERLAGCYRWLLRAYSPRFRHEYGAEMTRLLCLRMERAAARRGLVGIVACWARALVDIAVNAPRERLSTARRPLRHERAGRAGPPRKGDRMRLHIFVDLRHAARRMARQPGLTLTLVVTLAVGTGAAITIFSVVDAALVHPLPYPAAERMISIAQLSEEFGTYAVPPPFLSDLRERTTSFEALAGFSPTWSLTLTGAGEPRVISAAYVSDGLLDMLGVQPISGRLFAPLEHLDGGPRVAVVSRRFWRRQFSNDAVLHQQSILLNGEAYSIVGIAPDAAMPIASSAVSDDESAAELWLPFAANPYAQLRNVPVMNVIGLLREGVSPESASAELDAVRKALAAEFPAAGLSHFVATPLAEMVSRASRPTVLLLFAASGLLLLVACVNVANLMLNRALQRGREIGVRAALGAGRGRLVAQELCDSLLVAVLGVACGFLVASWLLSAVPALGITGLPQSADVRIDLRVAGFAMALAVGTAALFGSVPAAFASRLGALAGLRNRARDDSSGSGGLRRTLVVAEIALAMVLLVGAGLLGRSFWRLTRVDPGFRTERLVSVPLSLAGDGTRTAAEQVAFLERATDRLRELPGVEQVTAVNRVPFGGSNVLVGVEVEGRPSADGAGVSTDRRVVTPGYFDAMGIDLVDGRDFDARDVAGSEAPAVIVNEKAASLLWPDRQGLGRRLHLMLRSGPGPWLTVVGVVGDIHHHGLADPIRPEVYVPYAQAPVATMVALLRGPAEAETVMPLIKNAVWGLDPDMPLDSVHSVEALVSASVSEPRFRTVLVTAFASLALLLAAVGVAGVISFSVAQRTRDIGIRVALGAPRGEILWMTVRQGLGLGVVGIGVGLAGSLAVSRFIEALLFEVAPSDPTTLAAVAAGLILLVAAASYLPARRATRIDPIVALHES